MFPFCDAVLILKYTFLFFRMTFVTGCLISNKCLDVLIKNGYDLKDCYQQVINAIPLNVEHHLVNVRYASEAVPELSVTEVDVAR